MAWKIKYHRLDEKTLVQQCKRGDGQAMAALIEQYQDRLYNILLRICGNPDDAMELVQDTFVKAIENIGEFRNESSLYTWLFRIGVNLALNFCRRRNTVPLGSLDERLDAAAAVMDKNSPDPSQLAQRKEIVDLLLSALARLDDDHRVIIVLRDIEQMSYEQIAQTLDCELGTVKSRLSRARAQLRQMLEPVLV